ncbi:hypothetical protein TWF730_007602 [Orbilia blumenaviensis]|uniref:Uncharacterized protein n=1 Tax=Orbilia blumenaviensis TaxID=1796055 RepID=A0AAV9VC30_9PEZI
MTLEKMKAFTASFVLLTAVLPSIILGEVVFTSPVAGNSFKYVAGNVGVAVTVRWTDNDEDPVVPPAGLFTLDLCTGSNDQIFPLITLGTPGMAFSTANGLLAVTIPPGVAGDGPYYFLRMIWTTTDGSVTNWSDRFELEGMLGVFTPAMITANQAAGSDKPDAVHPQKAAPVPDPNGGDFAVPYGEQTGNIRYAPMQPRPGSTITAKNMKRLNPTSAYTVFTTKGGPPKVATTVTEARTYAQTTVVNEAAPAPMPDEAMARFLNRWKD